MDDIQIKHCIDCCCAQSWEALGITEYTGKSIPEHIVELRAQIEAMTPDWKLGGLVRIWGEQSMSQISKEGDDRFHVKYLWSHVWNADLEAALLEALGEEQDE